MSAKYMLVGCLTLVFACKNNNVPNGNYYYCQDDVYSEFYFKKDSMRVASDDEWIRLSEWRSIEVKNDTLYFETFGEWRLSVKAKLNINIFNEIELEFIPNNTFLYLYPIKKTIDFENFWGDFENRKKYFKCDESIIPVY